MKNKSKWGEKIKLDKEDRIFPSRLHDLTLQWILPKLSWQYLMIASKHYNKQERFLIQKNMSKINQKNYALMKWKYKNTDKIIAGYPFDIIENEVKKLIDENSINILPKNKKNAGKEKKVYSQPEWTVGKIKESSVDNKVKKLSEKEFRNKIKKISKTNFDKEFLIKIFHSFQLAVLYDFLLLERYIPFEKLPRILRKSLESIFNLSGLNQAKRIIKNERKFLKNELSNYLDTMIEGVLLIQEEEYPTVISEVLSSKFK